MRSRPARSGTQRKSPWLLVQETTARQSFAVIDKGARPDPPTELERTLVRQGGVIFQPTPFGFSRELRR